MKERKLIDRLKALDEPAFRLMVDKFRNRVYYSDDHIPSPKP